MTIRCLAVCMVLVVVCKSLSVKIHVYNSIVYFMTNIRWSLQINLFKMCLPQSLFEHAQIVRIAGNLKNWT